MAGPWEGWVYLVGPDGSARELINHARSAAYLQNVDLPNGMLLCDVLEFGGCESYAYEPPCGEEVSQPSHAIWRLPNTGSNRMFFDDNAAFQLSTQGDVRFAIDGVVGGSTVRYIAFHGAVGPINFSWSVHLSAADILVFTASTNGTATSSATCDVALTESDGLVLGRVTWRNSDGRVQFFRKESVNHLDIEEEMESNTGWEQIGANETLLSGSTLHNSTAVVTIGAPSSSSTENFHGSIYALSIAPTIDAAAGFALYPPAFPEDTAAASFTSSTGQTITVSHGGAASEFELFYSALAGWSALSFTTPDVDEAPWYNAAQPESGEALGFFIDDWTGLGNEHVHRQISPKGGWGGGAQLGPLSAGARTMAFGVQMFATSAEGMEYLFRWLEQTLYNVCDTCATDGLLIRRFCPSTDDLWHGVVRLNGVGLTAGPNWENELLQINKCYHRRVSFVLTVSDPCMYLPGTEFSFSDSADLTQCFDDVGVDVDRNPCRPACIELSANNADCRQRLIIDVDPIEAAVAPVVTLENATTEYTVPTRVLVYYDPAGVSPTNPCSLQLLGELYVRPIRPGATLQWNVAEREVHYRDHTTGLFVPGWAYIDPNDPPVQRWFTLPCGRVDVVLEPSSLCLEDQGGGIYSDGSHTFEAPAFPSPSVELVPRIGCP